MSIETTLENLKHFDALIALKEKEKNRLSTLLYRAEIEPKQAEFSDKIRNEYKTIDLEIKQLYKAYNELMEAMGFLPYEEQLVLHLRYIHNEPWGEISRQLQKSRTSCWMLKNKAIEHLKKGC